MVGFYGVSLIRKDTNKEKRRIFGLWYKKLKREKGRKKVNSSRSKTL